MSKLNAVRRIAVTAGIAAVLLGSAACTKTVDGTPTAAPVTKKSTEGETVTAPDESYIYDTGTVVTLTAAEVADDMDGLLSNEVGRVLKFTVENDSDESLDLSGTRSDAEVDCDGSSQYVFPSKDFGGPETLESGDSGDYDLSVAVKKEDAGKACTVTFPFESESAGDGTSVATFEMVL